MDINIRVAGEAGQGVQTTGNLLVGAMAKLGLHVVAVKSYMSRVRGGLNWFDIRIGDRELHAGRETADLLVTLTDEARDVLGGEAAGGLVLHDADEAEGAVPMPFTRIARETAESAVMANSVAAGAVFAACGYDLGALSAYIGSQFGGKGEEVIEKNVACARRGAELAMEKGLKVSAPRPAGAPSTVVDGSSAIGLAAAAGGVKVVTAYPMTPGTATFTFLAGVADKYGIVVEQAEDEIAAVNMLCGASYAGAPALATTSGGGFALMAEGVSLAGIMELPIVIVVAQRPGPATGLPTRTGQQDLLFAVHAGHGEFPKAVFAPGTVRQSYDLTRRALEQAHAWQSPVILLTDQFLQDLHVNAEPFDEAYRPIDRRLARDAGGDYRRYAVTDSGVSPRAAPGGEAFVVSDSDEHTDAGRISEDLIGHISQQEKRMRKLDGLRAEALPPELHGPADAPTLLICWGSTYGPCREAVDRLNDRGDGPVAMVHVAQPWPLDADAFRERLGRRERVVCVEGNATGQLATLLRAEGVLGDVERLLRYDGMPFTAEYIMDKLAEASS